MEEEPENSPAECDAGAGAIQLPIKSVSPLVAALGGYVPTPPLQKLVVVNKADAQGVAHTWVSALGGEAPHKVVKYNVGHDMLAGILKELAEMHLPLSPEEAAQAAEQGGVVCAQVEMTPDSEAYAVSLAFADNPLKFLLSKDSVSGGSPEKIATIIAEKLASLIYDAIVKAISSASWPVDD